MTDFTDAQRIALEKLAAKAQELEKLAAKVQELLDMEENYQRATWLGRFVWKLVIAAGAAAAGVAAFKDHIVHIFKGG